MPLCFQKLFAAEASDVGKGYVRGNTALRPSEIDFRNLPTTSGQVLGSIQVEDFRRLTKVNATCVIRLPPIG